MPFTTGFLSGITLTTTLLTLTLFQHQRNRTHQASLLHQQSLLLTSIVEPSPEPPTPLPRYVLAKPSVLETVKDAWNEDVVGAVRWVQGVEWGSVREGVEMRVRGLLRGRGMGEREGLEVRGDGAKVLEGRV
ncbi:hypothetical protein MMC16_000752 [Acarospora aff. strigata]|nr:hypothetical protein [Acarospora aff. strigata]